MKLSIRLIQFLLLLLMISACSTQAIRVNNFAYLYNSDDIYLRPSYKVYSKSIDTTSVYFKVNTAQLLYTRPDKNGDFTARFKLELKVYASTNLKIALRYDSTFFTDRDNEQLAKDLIGKFDFNLPADKNYLIAIRLTDLNRNVADVKTVNAYKQNEQINRNAYLTYLSESENPYLNPFHTQNQSIKIRHQLSATQKIGAYFYENNYTLAAPAFDVNSSSNTRFTSKVYSELAREDNFFYLPETANIGFYFLVSDSSKTIGNAVHVFESGFPKVVNAKQLLEPLRYITTNEEYKNLSQNKNTKEAVEKFWIDRAGSKERAKELIKGFYKRVELTNEYFTSFKEGWKTDRGMIYLLFGMPDGVYKKDETETWVYGQESNVLSLSFVFEKSNNPFSDNDYILLRNTGFRPIWFTAIDAWRAGRIFTL